MTLQTLTRPRLGRVVTFPDRPLPRLAAPRVKFDASLVFVGAALGAVVGMLAAGIWGALYGAGVFLALLPPIAGVASGGLLNVLLDGAMLAAPFGVLVGTVLGSVGGWLAAFVRTTAKEEVLEALPVEEESLEALPVEEDRLVVH
jgi:hypothetical protein